MSEPVDVAGAYRAYFPLLLRKCERMLGSGPEAQDLAQDTFVRLWTSRADLRDTDRVVAWLYTTSTRLAVDRLRARRPVEGLEEVPSSDAPDRVVAARALIRRVARDLDPHLLEILVLSRVDGLSQPELASVVGTSERTIRRRLVELDRRLSEIGDDHG